MTAGTRGSTARISLRPAEENDIGIIHEFIQELADFERLSHEVVATEALLQQFLFAERPVAEAIIAEYDGTPAGFALFFYTFSTFLARPGLYLEDLFVRPGLRGKGIGKALLRYLANLAIERDCGRVEWSVLDWNQSAIQFYEKLGAAPMAEWTVYRLAGSALREFTQGR